MRQNPITQYIGEKKYSADISDTLALIEESYCFAVEKNDSKSDDRFIKWMVDKKLDKSLI